MLITEKEMNLLTICFDNNKKKIEAFLNLVNLMNFKLNNTEQKLTGEIKCMHQVKENTCLLNFPDSIGTCTKPCNFYRGVIK